MRDKLKLLIPPDEIDSIVDRVASEIRKDFAGKDPILLGVLKGAFVFLSDIVRALEMPFEVDFIQASCYGKRDSPSAEVLIKRDLTADIKGRDVIIVEGIIDRGHTARALTEYLKKKGPSSIKVCTFLLREGGGGDGLKVDYVGKRIGDGFVIGYGMDYKEEYRGLAGLYIME